MTKAVWQLDGAMQARGGVRMVAHAPNMFENRGGYELGRHLSRSIGAYLDKQN